jgi:DNA-binding NtrC family response regulator
MTSILVVDDEPQVCELFTDCLREEFCANVDFALTGRDGRLLLKGYRFDLAVIDVSLPDMSGLELAELAANENTAVLLTSGHPDSCEKLGRFKFPHLEKPFSLDTLIGEAATIIRDARENVRRVRTASSEMRAHTEALEDALDEARRLVVEMKARTSPNG